MPLRAFIAVPAILIGGALLWVAATGSDEPGAGERATSLDEREAVRIERRLDADPTNKALLAATIEAWMVAGADQLYKIDSHTQPIPDAVVEDYEAGLRVWPRYLRQADDEVGTDVAETIGRTLFQLVEIGSTDPATVTRYAADAVRAQKIVGEQAPNLLTLTNLGTYQYFNGEYAAGDRTTERALPHIRKEERDTIAIIMEQTRERGERFVARVERGFRTLEETGEEELGSPIKGYGSPAGVNSYEPGAGPE